LARWDGKIKLTQEVDDWLPSLSVKESKAVNAVVAILQQDGPAMRRPTSGQIKSAKRHKTMRELVVPAGNIRILYMFDPLRNAVLLIGGTKTNNWDKWYAENVPKAEDIYDEYLKGED
jgi:hypothetical protein